MTGNVLSTVFCSICGFYHGRVPISRVHPGAHGRRLFRGFVHRISTYCGVRHSMVFCTGGLYLAPGRLSKMIGRIDNGATNR